MKWTRADYMKNRVSHADYYGQFATPEVQRLVEQRIGEARIKASKDPHFNDIPLGEWDRLHGDIMRLAPRDSTDVHWNTLGVSVCIAKEAARRIKNAE